MIQIADLANLMLGVAASGNPAILDGKSGQATKEDPAGSGFQELVQSLLGDIAPAAEEVEEVWAGQQKIEAKAEAESEDDNSQPAVNTDQLLGSTKLQATPGALLLNTTSPADQGENNPQTGQPETTGTAGSANQSLVAAIPVNAEPSAADAAVAQPVVAQPAVVSPEPSKPDQVNASAQVSAPAEQPTAVAHDVSAETAASAKPSAALGPEVPQTDAVETQASKQDIAPVSKDVPKAAPTDQAAPEKPKQTAHTQPVNVQSINAQPAIAQTPPAETPQAQKPVEAQMDTSNQQTTDAPVIDQAPKQSAPIIPQKPETQSAETNQTPVPQKTEQNTPEPKKVTELPFMLAQATDGRTESVVPQTFVVQPRSSMDKVILISEQAQVLTSSDSNDMPVESANSGQGSGLESKPEHQLAWLQQSEIRVPGFQAVNAVEKSQGFHVPQEAVGSKMIHQIVQAAKVNLFEGGADMTLRLDPPHLGTLHMNVSAQEGVVTANLQTSNEVARHILQADLSSLKQALADAGINVDSINVSVGNQSNQGWNPQSDAHGRQNQHGHNAGSHSFAQFMEEPEMAAVMTMPDVRQYQSSGQLNYLA